MTASQTLCLSVCLCVWDSQSIS